MAAMRMSTTFAAAIFFCAATTTALSQQLNAAAPSAQPVPGFLDGDAGARKLRYRCTGEGAPTVLIETGGDTSFETLTSWEKEHGFRPGWLIVVADIEKVTRVCVYDRAGVGRSGKARQPRTSADVATDLKALLRNEKIDTPIICVGIGKKPLIVLTAGLAVVDPMIPEPRQAEAARIHQELQKDLLSLSTRSKQVIAVKAGHNIQREEPRLIIDAVVDVIQQVRSRP